MKSTFTIPESKREDVQKLVAKFQKKADKYGVPLSVEFGKPYGTKIAVNRVDESTGVIRTVDTMMIEAFDLTISGELIRKDGYTVVAKLEHLDGGNVVTAFGEENNIKWSNLDCHCEHCKSNRQRRVTFIVKHENGAEKQIGSTCLKEYCGIDPMAIGYRNELTDILLSEDVRNYDFIGHPVGKVYDPIEILALAIRIEKKHGYVRSSERRSNRGRIEEEIRTAKFDAEEIAEAKKMAKAISAISEEDARKFLLDNTKVILDSTYCKDSHFGYLAYAPVAYRKYIAELARREELKAKHDAQLGSQYIGEIGERVLLNITEAKLLTSWENEYGYTYLYKFVDDNGNILIWYASKFIDADDVKTIKGTVKDHCERDEIRQTVLTRCKVA